METFSTRQAARKLGLTPAALSKYIKSQKVPPPRIIKVGRLNVHIWTDSDVERVREILPKIKNGRKTWRKQETKSKKKVKR